MSSYLSHFNYQITGPEDGRRWVFLHGLMGYGMNWRRIVKSIEDSERVLVYDQRGHGKSWQPLTGYQPQDFADDLFLIIQELGWEKIILVGHSMGARNAMQFASQFPEKVEKLVLEDMGPEGNPRALDFYNWLFSVVPSPFPNRAAAKDFFFNQFRSLVKGRTSNPETLGAYLYSNFIENEKGEAHWRFNPQVMLEIIKVGRVRDQWKEFKALTMPTLVIRGENSNELTSENFELMLSANDHVTGIEVSNAGHWVHSDQPEEFIKVIRQFTDLS